MRPAPVLRFHVLGEFTARAGGRDLPLPGHLVRAVLGALLLAPGEVVADERLLEMAWGPEKGSRRALQCVVSRLRSWLAEHTGPDCRLLRIGTGYRIDVPDGSVDICRFRDQVRAGAAATDPACRMALLSAALDEWRGPVLGSRPEFLGADPLVRAVEQARVDCGCQLADLALRLGRAPDALPYVSELAGAAPYDEPLQARLVRLTLACGRPAEALQQAERVRRRLADDLGVAPSAEVSSARTAVLRGTDALPAQLPPDVPDFTGRAAELRWVADRVGGRRPAVTVVAVTGMAGVGKSTLAVHAAHRLATGFPDGQLYADLNGDSTGPADVLAWFLGALGVDPAALPATTEERTALYRSRTAGRRILVVVDNAAAERQVRPLVPGSAGCAVLVTGRTALVGLAGARRLGLDVLSTADAVMLLSRVAGEPVPAAAEIVRLCDRLPLAVRIAGTHLAARNRWSPGRLVEALRDEERRLDVLTADDLSVRAGLESAYRDLAPAVRRTFRLLGRLDAELTVPGVAAALGVPAATAQEHLDALAAANLINVCDAGGQLRFRFVDLVRLFARTHID